MSTATVRTARALLSAALLSACASGVSPEAAPPPTVPAAAPGPSLAPVEALDDGGAGRAGWGPSVGGCRISISPAHVAVTVGQPVDLTVTFANDGPDDTELGRIGFAFQDCRYTLLRGGEPVPYTQRGRRLLAGYDPTAATTMTLWPGDAYPITVRLSSLFDLSEPGRYTLEVQRDFRTYRPGAPRVSVVSNRILIDVADPPYPPRLPVENGSRRDAPAR